MGLRPGSTPADVTAELDALYADLPEGEVLCGSGGPEVGVGSDHAAAARALIGAASDPLSMIPASDDSVLWLRNADIRGATGTTVGVWPAAVGPDAYAYTAGAPPFTAIPWVGVSSGRAIYQTTSGVPEIRWQASNGGFAPILPGDGTDQWTVCVVVVNAVLTGTAAAILGWGQNTSDRNVALFSRFNSVSQWRLSIRSFSTTDTTNSITNAASPSSANPTALLASFDGTTISFWEAESGDADWVSIGTLTHSLDVLEEHPIMLARTGTGTPSISSGLGIREVVAWRAALDSDARTALRTYVTAAGLL